MARKRKPYGEINRNRTLSNNASKKNPVPKKNPPKEKPKNIENTTRIKIEKEKSKNSLSLDTSFLEGRLKEKNTHKKEKQLRKKGIKYKNLEKLKYLFFSLSFLCVVILILLVVWDHYHLKPEVEKEEEKAPVEEKIIDDNYLFVGDFHTSHMPVEEKYPTVIMAEDNMTTDALLNDLNHRVYIYNPSVVFIELGLEDLVSGSRVEDIVDRYQKIIQSIQENRPNASIYVESVYPINSDKIDSNNRYHNINNATIKKLNQELKNIATKNEITYLDVYSELSKSNQLQEEYTIDGVSLNEKGYSVVWKNILKVIEKE